MSGQVFVISAPSGTGKTTVIGEVLLRQKDINLIISTTTRAPRGSEKNGVDYSIYWKEIRGIVSSAVQKMDNMRAKEGSHLLKDQRIRVKKISDFVQRISKCADENYKKHHKKCMDKILAASSQSQNGFANAELDKMDIAEELTRLKSHISQYSKIIGQSAAMGRQLDFILQEMNREINTIGSKSGDSKISTVVISIKSELEKLREQAQNIE